MFFEAVGVVVVLLHLHVGQDEALRVVFSRERDPELLPHGTLPPVASHEELCPEGRVRHLLEARRQLGRLRGRAAVDEALNLGRDAAAVVRLLRVVVAASGGDSEEPGPAVHSTSEFHKALVQVAVMRHAWRTKTDRRNTFIRYNFSLSRKKSRKDEHTYS